MQKVVLGKTGLEVNKNGFGALPVQRVTKKEAVYLLQKAFYHGINYFDTARMYTDSEEKMGAAFAHTRERIVISTKTGANNAEGFWRDLEESMRNLPPDAGTSSFRSRICQAGRRCGSWICVRRKT